MADRNAAQTNADDLVPLLGSHVAEGATRIDWSPDGTTIAAANANWTGSIELMDPESGHSIRSWNAHRNHFVRDVAWSPNGRLLASCGDDGDVVVWDSSSGGVIGRQHIRPIAVLRVAWSPDGSRLAVSLYGMPPRIYSDAQLSGFEELSERASTIAWDPSSRFLAFETSEDEIGLYDVGNGQISHLFDAGLNPLSMAWSPDRKWLAVGGSTGLVMYEVEGKTSPTIIESATGAVYNLQFSPDGTLLVVAGDSAIEIWRREPWELVTTIPGKLVTSVAWAVLPTRRVGASMHPKSERLQL